MMAREGGVPSCQPRARTGRKPETLSRSQAMSKPALTRKKQLDPLRETTF